MSGAPFGLVIFDNDGVLVDSEGHAQFVTAALLTRCGLPMTPADCRVITPLHSFTSRPG